MFLKMFASWMCGEKETFNSMIECKVCLQNEKEFHKECCKSVDELDLMIDRLICFGGERQSDYVLKFLEFWKKANQRKIESQKRIETYYGIILQYESWLEKC